MPNYSYKVRVLAAVDAHGSGSVHLLTIEAKVRSDCQANNINLPSTWRRWVKTTIEKLVEDEWLQDKGHQTYASTPALRALIAEEKARLGAAPDNHELKTFTALAKKLTTKPVSMPPRSQKRRSLAIAVEIENTDDEAGGETNVQPNSITVRPTKKPRVRYSDPGPSRAQSKRLSLPAASASEQPSSSKSNSRRRTSGGGKPRTARSNRRHTLPAVINANSQALPVFTAPVSKELQFIPLRQALSARARRALRRTGLSDEINSIDAEKREAGRKNREELARLRKELAESAKKLEELERLLQAARLAPPSETGSVGAPSVGMAPIYEDDEPEDVSSPAPFASSSAPRTPFRYAQTAISPAIRRLQEYDPGETPISRRDRKIRDLESKIESLRQDISQREEEEKRRAEEEELFHDAEEQILREDMSTFTPEFTSTPKRSVSFREGGEEEPQPTQVFFGGADGEAAEEEEDDVGAPFSETQESAADTSIDMDESLLSKTSQPSEVEVENTIMVSSTTITTIHSENDTLKASVEAMKRRIEELEQERTEAQLRPEVYNGGTQTDPYVDAEVKKLREVVEELEDNNQLLEQSSLEERHRIWEKIRGHISSLEHEPDGMEDLDMAISEILTNLALAESLAGERAKAQEKAERDLIVERRAKEERETELSRKNAEIEKLATKIEELTDLRSKLEKHSDTLESEKEKLENTIVDLKAALRREQDRVNGLEENLLSTTAKVDDTANDLAEIMELFDDEVNSMHSNSEDAAEETMVEKITKFVESLRDQKEELEGTIEDLEADLQSEKEVVKELRKIRVTLEAKYQDALISARELEASLTNKEKDMESIEEQLGELKGKYDEIQKTNDMLNGVIATKNEKTASLTKQINLLNEELDLLSQKNELTLQTVDELEAKIDKISDIIADKDEEIEELKRLHSEQLAGKDKEIDSLTQKLSKLTAENEIINGKIVKLENVIVNKDEIISRLENAHAEEMEMKTKFIAGIEQEILSLHGKVSQLTGEQTVANKKIDELNDLLSEKEDAIANLSKMYDEDIAEKDAQINNLQQQTSAQKEELLELTNSLGSLSDEKEEAEKKVSALLEEMEEKEEQISELKKNLHEVISRKDGTINEMSEELAFLREQLSSLSTQHSTLEEHVNKLENAKGLLRKEVEGLNAEIEEKEKIIQELEKLREALAANAETIDSLNDQLLTLTGQLEHVTEKHEQAESKIEELTEEVARKEMTVAQLESDLDQASSREAEAYKRYTDAITVQEQLKEQVEHLASGSEELKGTVEDRESELKQLKGRLDEKEAEIEELKSAVDDRDNTIEQRDEDIELLKEQISDLQESIREVSASHKKQIESLKTDLMKEKSDAIASMELRLQSSIQSRADLETELFQVCTDYKTKIATLEQRIRGLEQDNARAEGEAEDLRLVLRDMEEDKDEAIDKLKRKMLEITKEKERTGEEFTAELERRRETISTLEKKLHDLENSSKKQEQAFRDQINSQAVEIVKLRQDIANLQEDLLASHDAEDALELELQEKETEAQLLKEEMDEVKIVLQEKNELLSKELDAIRLELSETKNQMLKEIQQHNGLMKEKDAMASELSEQIEVLNAENAIIKREIRALSIDNKKWQQLYNQAVDDGAAAIDDLQNNLMTALTRAGEKKAEYLERSKTRLATELPASEDRQNITFVDQETAEAETEEGIDSISSPLSPDSATNVSTLISPPTPTSSAGGHGLGLAAMYGTHNTATVRTSKRKYEGRGKRRDDSGIGVDIGEDDEDVVEDEEERRFVEYGRHRAGFDVAT